MILTAEKDREDFDLLRRLIDVEPVDGAVNGEISDAGQNIVTKRATNRKQGKPVRSLADAEDALRAMIEGFLDALAKAQIALEQMVKN